MQTPDGPHKAGPLPLVVEQAWGKLISAQYIDSSLLRQEIALSWQRCLSNKVDPHSSRNERVANDFLKRDQEQYLLTVALPHMQRLYELVKGKDYIVMLSTADGTLLSVFGDKRMYSTGESLNIVPGASCSESVLGTTSPGICLVQKAPLQVFGQEHYCQLYHTWCCSAAPICDSQGNLLGILDLSNRDREQHPPAILELVKMAAHSIQLEFNYRVLQEDFKKSHFYFNMVVNSFPDALIFFDKDDKISHLNRNAVKLLGTASQQLIGRKIQSVSPNFERIKQDLMAGQHWTELQFRTQTGTIQVNAFLKPLKNEYMEPFGIVCTLKEDKKIKPPRNTAHHTFDDFVCAGKKLRSLVLRAKKAASTDSNILIEGESGTGKEILAQAIHNNSPRRNKPFIAVNCAALPQELIQSELFGYEEGTFTGAQKGGKVGKFELGNEGTIFLDEIGDMPIEAQANLLRVLQEKSIVRVGGSHPVPLDIRVLCATNKNLLKEIEASNFRLDLFYRLAVMRFAIPPLRERKEDIWPLVEHLAAKHHPALEELRFSPAVKTLFEIYDWPGNVRELENVVVNFLNKMENDTVTCDDLPEYLTKTGRKPGTVDNLKDIEQKAIETALAKCGDNISKTARMLGISRATLYRKLHKGQGTAKTGRA